MLLPPDDPMSTSATLGWAAAMVVLLYVCVRNVLDWADELKGKTDDL
jgi:hypothetical protein